MMTQTPYANLHPDIILNATESLGYTCNGRLLALNSYENRVYQVGIENSTPLVIKFYRPNRWSVDAIIEEHQFALELAQLEIPVVAPIIIADTTLHSFAEFQFALYPCLGGRPLELDNLEQLEWMGRFIGRIHAAGATKQFKHRIELNVRTYGYNAYEFLVQNQFIPSHLEKNYILTMSELLQCVEKIYHSIPSLPTLRLHGDCHAGNILWRNQGPHIVDLDDCLTGPAMQDIWMMLSGDKTDHQLQLDTILESYEEFFEFDNRQIKLIEVLRTLRMIHYAGWLAKRWNDPAFPLNFPWFNTEKYWDTHLQHMREQLELLSQF